MREISATKRATRDAQFEAFIDRIKESGGEITLDETVPLYTDVGMQEFEVGTERVVEFSVNHTDFHLSRKTETHILQGSGHQKHINELDPPRINIVLKRKSETSNDWQVMDLEDMF
ncbi:hypothetical protein HY604_04040 [Candidatus Peregrinibacteria bacterium]|nr:hypothetical protein [Candidatus Peregrinibacteria bacterium]